MLDRNSGSTATVAGGLGLGRGCEHSKPVARHQRGVVAWSNMPISTIARGELAGGLGRAQRRNAHRSSPVRGDMRWNDAALRTNKIASLVAFALLGPGRTAAPFEVS